MGAGGELIANQGQMSPEMMVENGCIGRMNYQAADVRKPLAAVSAINAQGNPVWFDGEKSYILPAGAPELKALRDTIQKVNQKIQLHCINGVYKMKSWARPATPFQGPGR